MAAPAPSPRHSLVEQAVTIARAQPSAPRMAKQASGAAGQASGADSVKNGALIGAGLVGGAVLVQGFRTCRETGCASDVLLWTGLGAGVGALAGAVEPHRPGTTHIWS